MSPPASPAPLIVGEHPDLLAVLQRAIRVAPTRTPVLVTGESGTGKELMARLLHERGPTPAGPLVAVNCGTLSRDLAESELFGHERGAFTGAGARRTGWFEEASGGTLVLDEIGELPLDLQPKLLRVLETGRLRRVGGHGEVGVTVRVVAMTLRDLRAATRAGSFRLDLFYRLAGIELRLPPLRERRSDLALLAEHFLREVETELGPRAMTADALARLHIHDWPGNVRELRNTLRRAALLVESIVDADDLEIEGDMRLSYAADADTAASRLPASSVPAPAPTQPVTPLPGYVALRGRRFDDLEREIYRHSLAENRGSRRRAARALGISRSTFCDRLRRMGI